MTKADYTLCLMSPEGGGFKLSEFAAGLEKGLGSAGQVQVSWLHPTEACDISFNSDNDYQALKQLFEQQFEPYPVDWALFSSAYCRQKQLLIADMDSTLIQGECIDELAEVLGLKPQVEAITQRAMRGELDFESALQERVSMLKGLSLEQLQLVLESIELMPGAKDVVATMKAKGGTCVLVSGGFTFFAQSVQNQLGMDASHANQLEVEQGKLTGQVHPPILGREAKLQALLHYSEQLNLEPNQVLAVGDGANDLAMIQAAGMGVAFHAKALVAEAAEFRLRFMDLRGLLYLQGYRSEDFLL